MAKNYGLIIPGKEKKEAPQPSFSRPSVFGDESSDESSDDGRPKVRGKIQGPTIGPGALERRQARSIQQKALAEDPTVFQYDELYDEIETKRNEEKKTKNVERKPKYISKLLQQAERRKLENERRVERQVQKEREAEGEEFKDKESFVTAAYKKKLEELKIAEEAEKREDYLEAIGDVRKQGNLDGFYRHLYEQKLGPKDKDNVKESSSEQVSADTMKTTQSSKPRTYRKRQSSEEEENEDDQAALKKAHIQSNLDADSDFSIDDSSSEDEPEKKKNEKESSIKTEADISEVVIKTEPKNEEEVETKEEKVEIKQEVTEKPEEFADKEVKEEEPKVKIDIWKKRTVGEAFDAALLRYYERKNSRNA